VVLAGLGAYGVRQRAEQAEVLGLFLLVAVRRGWAPPPS
jgi:hypothetical protein